MGFTAGFNLESAFEKTADTGALMDMGIGYAAGRDIDPVAAPQVTVPRFEIDGSGKFVDRCHAVALRKTVRIGRTAFDQFIPEDPRTIGPCGDRRVAGREPGGIRAEGRATAFVAHCRHTVGEIETTIATRQSAGQRGFLSQNVGVNAQNVIGHFGIPPCYLICVSQPCLGGKNGRDSALTPLSAPV